ncbi:hypothetical protein IKG64_03100 [Candidatus Saccharibacteria bacterium]|nr:hypothetical protein [Candidatus Saccharibacteria bacterium]
MLITKNERKNLSTQKNGKRAGGCWYRSRRLWPKATLYNVEMSDNSNQYESSLTERFLPLATPLANYYYGEFSSRVQTLATALFDDIYHNPASALEMVIQNRDCAREYGADLFSVMTMIGDFNVFFDDGNVKDGIIEVSEEIAKDLFFTSKRIGMPVKAFLLYFKGANLRREDISTMSGIPAKYIQWTYNILTTYMWEMLDGIHRHKAQELKARRKHPVRQPAEDIQLLVDFSNKPRPKTEEPATEEPVADPDPMEAEVAEADGAADEGAVIPWDDDADTGATTGEPDGDKLVFDQYPFDPDAGNDL